MKGVKVVCRFLHVLTCYSQCARVLALRELLEQSIYNEPAKYFGAKEKFDPQTEDVRLLQQNHKQVRRQIDRLTHHFLTKLFIYYRYLISIDLKGTSVMLAQRHSSVFHAGVIGLGPRKPPPENRIDHETITLNTTLLMDAIKVRIRIL